MKGQVLAFTTLLFIALPSHSESSRLGRFAEYHVGPYDLITFSREAAVVRLCEGCEPRRLTLNTETRLLEREQTISLKRATELYLSRPYARVFVGLDRQTDRIDYLRFGGHSDEQGD